MNKKCLAALLLAALPTACGDDKPGTTMPDASMPDTPASACAVTPGAWSAPSYDTNAATALAIRARVEAVSGSTSILRTAETMPSMVDEVSDIEAVHNAGTPAMSAHVQSGFDAILDDVFAEMVAAAAAGNKDLVGASGWDVAGAPDGGIFVTTNPTDNTTATRAFNAGAIELRQIAHKGLFAGGAMYPYALTLTEGTITEATIDAIVAAFGSNAMIDPLMAPTHSANYAYQMGFHADIVEALTKAKAYATDSNCTAERDAALVTAFRKWEQSMFARFFFYANNADTKLAAAANDHAISVAYHDLGEGLGLAMGFYGLPNPTSGPLANAGRKVTDADIDAMLAAIRVNRADLNASTAGSYVADTGAFATGVAAVATRLKQVYSLTDADIASYKVPTKK